MAKYKKSNDGKQYLFGSLINKGVTGLAETLGADEKTAQLIGSGISTATGLIPGMQGNLLQGADMVGDIGSMFMENGGQLVEYNGFKHNDNNPQNVHSGIPQGNAVVEDGETNFNDYVFSDKLKVNKTLAEEFSLPKKAIGKTFAEVSKIYKDDSRPNDIYNKRAARKELINLQQAQEAFKQVEMPQESNMMAYGGKIDKGNVPKYSNFEEMVRKEGFMLPHLTNSMRGISGVGGTSDSVYKTFDSLPENKRRKFALDAVRSYQDGQTFGDPTQGYNVDTNRIASMADGGFLSMFNSPEWQDTYNILQSMPESQYMSNINGGLPVKNPFEQQPLELRGTNRVNFTPQTSDQSQVPQDKSGLSLSDLRYAPAITDAAMAAYVASNKPTPTAENKYDTNVKFDPQLVNRNQINRNITSQQGAMLDSLSDAVGSDAGALRSNILGANLNTQKAIADADLQAEAMDAREIARTQGMNFRQDARNMGNRMAVKDMNDRDQGAYQTMLMDSLSNVGQNIGAIGQDEMYRAMMEGMPLDYQMNRQFNPEFKKRS